MYVLQIGVLGVGKGEQIAQLLDESLCHSLGVFAAAGRNAQPNGRLNTGRSKQIAEPLLRVLPGLEHDLQGHRFCYLQYDNYAICKATHLQKVLVIDVGVLRTCPQTTQHRLQQSNMFAAEQFHFLLEGFAHGNAHSQTEPWSPFQIRLPPTHLWVAARLIRTVARPPVLRWSHAAAFTAAGGIGRSSRIASICLTCDRSIVVAEEADEVVFGMLILEGGAQIARDSALQAAVAGKLIQMGRTGIDGPVVEAELAHRIRLIGEYAAKAAARGILIRPLVSTGIGAACATATGAGRVTRIGGIAVGGGEARSAVRNGQ